VFVVSVVILHYLLKVYLVNAQSLSVHVFAESCSANVISIAYRLINHYFTRSPNRFLRKRTFLVVQKHCT
jgi:hypothetical protein